jgi:hypothetical protein
VYYSFCRNLSEWRRGTVVRIHALDAFYDVLYDDGYIDFSLPAHCVKPHTIYKRNEMVYFQEEDEGKYVPAIVVGDYPEDAEEFHGEIYDLYTEHDGGWHTNVSPIRMLRVQEMLKVGVVVESLYEDEEGENWYPGTIERHNQDGFFSVRFHDDETIRTLDWREIRVPVTGKQVTGNG